MVSTKKFEDYKYIKIISALRIYNKKYGNYLVPRKFIIPSNIIWPKYLWEFKLGHQVKEIKYNSTNKSNFITFLKKFPIYDEFYAVFKSTNDVKWEHVILPALKNYYRLHKNVHIPKTFICPMNDENWPCVEHWGYKLGEAVDNIRSRNDFSPQILRSIEDLKSIKFGEIDLREKVTNQIFSFICRIKTDYGILVGIGVSGIKDSGYGVFNLTGSVIPKLSIICRYDGRIISSAKFKNQMDYNLYDKVVELGDLGESFVLVNKKLMEVCKFKEKYENRIRPYSAYLLAEGNVGGYFNDKALGVPSKKYWNISRKVNNCILVSGCNVDENNDEECVILNEVYVLAWRDINYMEEFFLAYGCNFEV